MFKLVCYRFILQTAVLLHSVSGVVSQQQAECEAPEDWNGKWWVRYKDSSAAVVRTYQGGTETNEYMQTSGGQGATTVKGTTTCVATKHYLTYHYYIRYKHEDPDVRECVRVADKDISQDNLIFESTTNSEFFTCSFGVATNPNMCEMTTSTGSKWQVMEAEVPVLGENNPYVLAFVFGSPGSSRIYTPELRHRQSSCISFYYYLVLGNPAAKIKIKTTGLTFGDTPRDRDTRVSFHSVNEETKDWTLAEQSFFLSKKKERIEFEGASEGNMTGSRFAMDRIVIFLGTCARELALYNFGKSEGTFDTMMKDSSSGMDWELTSGGTPTSLTGPRTGYGGSGFYMFVNSAKWNGQLGTSRIITPPLGYSGDVCIEFYYVMYGNDVGSLTVYAFNTEQQKYSHLLLMLSGGYGDREWLRKELEYTTLSAKDQIVFEAETGAGINGDIAVDEVRITTWKCRLRTTAFSPGSKTLKVAEQCVEADFPYPVNVLVKMPFNSTSCPFRRGRYSGVALPGISGSELPSCENDPGTFLVSDGDQLTLQTCLQKNTYGEMRMTCVAEPDPVAIGSNNSFGNLLFLWTSDLFLTARHKEESDGIYVSLHGNKDTERFQPRHDIGYKTLDQSLSADDLAFVQFYRLDSEPEEITTTLFPPTTRPPTTPPQTTRPPPTTRPLLTNRPPPATQSPGPGTVNPPGGTSAGATGGGGGPVATVSGQPGGVATTSSPDDSSGGNVAAQTDDNSSGSIAGAVVGVLLLLVIIAVTIFFLLRYRKKKGLLEQAEPEASPS